MRRDGCRREHQRFSRQGTESAPAAPEQATKLDTTTGFRGQKFGTSFSEFQGLTLEKDEGDLKLYTKKDENLQLGPVKLETVIYHFFQDKFFAVSLHTQDRDNTLVFCASRRRLSARETGDRTRKMTWIKTGSAKPLKLSSHVNPKTEEGSLFIRDNQIGSQVEAYWEKLTNDAANDL